MNPSHVRLTPLRSLVSLGALVLVLAVLPACDSILGPGDRGPPAAITELPRALSDTELELLSMSNRFGFDLLGEVLEQHPEETHFVSPLSVAMVLAMILNGADGETHEAIRETLRLDGVPESEINTAYGALIDLLGQVDPDVSFQLANGIWYRDGAVALHDDYTARVEEHFGARAEGVDFSDPATADAINAWVREATNGRIDDMAPRRIPATWVAVVMNAIHFEADWTWQFDRDQTRPRPFYLPGGGSELVPMMEHPGPERFLGHSNDAFGAVDLPYGGQAYAMTVIVPHPSNTVVEVLAQLAEGGWDDLTRSLVEGEVRVVMPRFELAWGGLLNDPLTAMGMGPAFEPGADWSRMFQDGSPGLSEVFQKSYVRVDEDGTEAAAATRATFEISLTGEFRADRPFLFMIRERLSGAILFMGAYMEPPA